MDRGSIDIRGLLRCIEKPSQPAGRARISLALASVPDIHRFEM